MATLQQTLRGLPKADDQLTRGPGGVLQRSSTLKQATQQAGLAAAPTTPMAAQMTGASAQAAKMAGTPQQVQAALQQATEQPTLQTALRQKQYGRGITEAEAGVMSKSADMQALGGLGDRVTKMVSNELGKAGTAKDVDLSADLAKIREEFKKDPTGKSQAAMDAMLRIVQSGQSLDKIQQLVPEAAVAIADIAAKTIVDPTTVKAAQFLPELGYTAESLAELLKVTPEEVQGYSLSQLQNKVNQAVSEEFTATQQLEQQAVSPLVGAAERGLAREAARELSATGVRASEADMQRLADEISTAHLVSFPPGTSPRPVDEILADDEISAIVKDIVESPEGSQLRKDIEAQAPDFYNFIKRNETILKEASAGLDTSTTEFKAIQTFNKSLFGDLSEKAIATYAPGATGFKSTRLTAADVPILTYRASLSDTERKLADNEFNKIEASNPDMAKEISTLSADQLATLGIGKKGSNYDKMISYNQKVDEVATTPDENEDSIVSSIYADAGSVEAANQTINNNNAMVALGYPSTVSRTQPINAAESKKEFLAANPKISITAAASGEVPKIPQLRLGKTKQIEDAVELNIHTTLLPVLKDGSLSAEEINDTRGPINKLNWDDLLDLRQIADRSGAKIDKPALDDKLNKLRRENTDQEFILVGGADRRNTDPALDIDRWARLLDPKVDDRKVDKAVVRDLISKTALGEFQSGRYRYKYADGTLDRIKQLGLLTPEHIKAFNELAASRAKAYETTGFPGGVNYPWGIDQQGNALQKPKNLVQLINPKGDRIIDVSPQDISYYEKQGYKIYKGR